MRNCGRFLSWIGGKGPILLVAALGMGLLVPPLGEFSYRLLPLSAFLLTLGSFLTSGLAAPDKNGSGWLLGLAIVWVGLVLPLSAAVLLERMQLDPALRIGVLLSLLAPPVGSAAAIAAMIGLKPRLALVVSLTLTLAAPISIPGFAALLGLGVSFDVGRIAFRLFMIIGAAAALAKLSSVYRDRVSSVLPDQLAATGVAVLGLVIVGLATSHGVAGQWISDRLRFLEMLAAAVIVNFGLCLLTTVLLGRLGLQIAGTIGLVSGNRNVTLAWAAASAGLPPLAESYVATCVIPVLTLPLIIKACVSLTARVRAMSRPAVHHDVRVSTLPEADNTALGHRTLIKTEAVRNA
ncbi:conserved membrane hypothetical protein [Bradyrhizobium sp. ORS 375]|nr:conserved membrane hypothetical protein [Bradyrhizobium sp. ORS 375]